MQRRITWVHGIGNHKAGYSDGWRTNFDRYLKLGKPAYVEVLWETVFDARASTRGRTRSLAPTAQEKRDEALVRNEIESLLLARASALGQGVRASATRGSARPVSWEDAQKRSGTRGFVTWLLHADEYLGDFTKYLVSRRVRDAVKERFKEKLRPFAGTADSVSVISHSWGTVVAYDSLRDLAQEMPGLKVVGLVTLGSPLWLVRRFLEDTSGNKPRNVRTWLNIHAQGDPIGSWLSKAFQVDKEYQVPVVGKKPPHSSYFVAENQAVQKDLVAPVVLA